MIIIQNKTQTEKMRKVDEMRDFFSHDDDLTKEYYVQYFMKVTCYLGVFFIGISLFNFCMQVVIQKHVMSNVVIQACIFLGIFMLFIGMFGYKNSREKAVMHRYNAQDMFLYWLFDESGFEKILVNIERDEVIFCRASSNVSLPLEGFSVVGDGTEVECVDLDQMILYTEAKYKEYEFAINNTKYNADGKTVISSDDEWVEETEWDELYEDLANRNIQNG